MRPEQTIFDDLAKLCSSPGYVHAIAYLSFRDNMMRYSGDMKPENMQHLFSKSRLIRTELSTLIGLLLKTDIAYRLPSQVLLAQYIDKTESLLDELHQTFTASFFADLDPTKIGDSRFNPFTSGAVLREPIFYGGESAYSFQYRDLSPRKYANDDAWLKANKGFSVQGARDVVYAVGRFLEDKALATLKEMRQMPPEQWTILPAHAFTGHDISNYAGIDPATVNQVLQAFAIPAGERNEQFAALNDYNIANALPLIRTADDTYILFHIYSLVESLYESPYYWMGADTAYVSTAMRHRGLFTEEFAAERLAGVFGQDNVHPNVDIFDSKGNKVGEIDVLVLFANRAIVLQAKSKRLSLESRKGNDGTIRDDFKKSIQKSCDQAYKCAKTLGDTAYTLKDTHSKEIAISMPIKAVYILCLVSDHYPALSFQTRQFIKYDATDLISPPFVLDVFTLDAMTEMLDSPLQLLSYVDRRTKYIDKVFASHEFTTLSYHLKQNLWLSDEYSFVSLDDDISTDLELAMLVRREAMPGKRTPDGILTRYAATSLGRLIKEIEARPDPATIDLGYVLLMLGEKAVVDISNGIDELAKRARVDGKSHDVTIGLGRGDTGLTIHCNDDPIEIAGPALEVHCRTRKYTQRAQSWFGVCIRPSDTSLRFGLNLDYKWERSEQMEAMTQNMAKPGKLPQLIKKPIAVNRKIGRNELCPCGSGKKYKKCCLAQ